jgi:hypothetical protein
MANNRTFQQKGQLYTDEQLPFNEDAESLEDDTRLAVDGQLAATYNAWDESQEELIDGQGFRNRYPDTGEPAEQEAQMYTLGEVDNVEPDSSPDAPSTGDSAIDQAAQRAYPPLEELAD